MSHPLSHPLIRTLPALCLSLFAVGCAGMQVEAEMARQREAFLEQQRADLVAEAEAEAASAAKDELEPYGMRSYVLALLKPGPGRITDPTPQLMELQAAHMANIGRLADEGKLLLAGPTGTRDGDDPIIGIFLFDTGAVETARAWTDSDPMIAAGHLRAELILWYGPIGITYRDADT